MSGPAPLRPIHQFSVKKRGEGGLIMSYLKVIMILWGVYVQVVSGRPGRNARGGRVGGGRGHLQWVREHRLRAAEWIGPSGNPTRCRDGAPWRR